MSQVLVALHYITFMVNWQMSTAVSGRGRLPATPLSEQTLAVALTSRGVRPLRAQASLCHQVWSLWRILPICGILLADMFVDRIASNGDFLPGPLNFQESEENNKMSILERIRSLLKANINEMLDKAEDPEKMLNQLIRDMEDGYREAREQVINAMADQKRLEKKYLANLNLAKEWEHKAEVAVQSGDEDTARKALKRAQDYEELSNDLKLALDRQEASVADLRVQLVALQAKIEEARQRRGVLVARHHRLQAEQKIRQSASGLKATDEAFAAFQRMEERIELEEMRMEAAAELEGEAEAVEARLAKEEAELQIEERLAALKARLAARSSTE